MPSEVRSITVTNAAIDTPLANVDTYAVSFETDYTLDTANIVAIQSFVFDNKDSPDRQQSIVKMTSDSCKLLQTHANLDSAPKNIEEHVYAYIVSLISKGTTSDALNHTMKTVTKVV